MALSKDKKDSHLIAFLNKQKKLLKHCKSNPNDKQSKHVLELIRGEN